MDTEVRADEKGGGLGDASGNHGHGALPPVVGWMQLPSERTPGEERCWKEGPVTSAVTAGSRQRTPRVGS